MKKIILLSFFCFALYSLNASAQEPVLESRLQSVALFKNGLAVVTRSVPITEPGKYLVDIDLQPVYGTFWISGENNIEIRTTRQELSDQGLPKPHIDFQNDLSGQQVEIFFKDNNIPPVYGSIIQTEPLKGEEAWSRNYERTWNYYYSHLSPYQDMIPHQNYLLLNTSEGITFVDPNTIAYLNVKNPVSLGKKKKNILEVNLKEPLKSEQPILITYLTKGIAWAPSYLIDISDQKNLTIKQKVVIKNEWEDIENVSIDLISGFPGIKFAHVTSPLSQRTNWQNFFNQLNQQIQPGHAAQANVMQQARISEPAAPSGLDLSALPKGEGVDLHFQSIGKRSLKEGDALTLDIDQEQTEYERIVEWIIPDTRNAEGRAIEEYHRREDPDKYQDAVWDAIRFKNPFDFPMTTAPAVITAHGHFNGQTMSYWVNAGEKTTLHITKALSIRTVAMESEMEDSRDLINLGGYRYRKVFIQGNLLVNNHRNEEIALLIRRRFSGDLIEATENPQTQLREEGAYSVNKRNEVYWELTLPPGGQKEITYKYSLLVKH